MSTRTCPSCGVVYGYGASPFCSHGHGPIRAAILPDEWPGGKVIENLGHEPVTVYSRSELKREMDKRNLMPKVQHRDGSKETSRWI